jgi:DNA-binding NtrC family response regulator
VRALLSRLLTLRGYRVLPCESGDVALAVAAQEPNIDLLLTDVVMPDISGRRLAELLSAQRPGLKVLYISGYTDESIASRGILERGIRLLEKPFTAEALAARVREILDADTQRTE